MQAGDLPGRESWGNRALFPPEEDGCPHLRMLSSCSGSIAPFHWDFSPNTIGIFILPTNSKAMPNPMALPGQWQNSCPWVPAHPSLSGHAAGTSAEPDPRLCPKIQPCLLSLTHCARQLSGGFRALQPAQGCSAPSPLLRLSADPSPGTARFPQAADPSHPKSGQAGSE